jgi:hypothetical protein
MITLQAFHRVATGRLGDHEGRPFPARIKLPTQITRFSTGFVQEGRLIIIHAEGVSAKLLAEELVR